MPKGKHKGGRRHFTNFEAEQERLDKEAKEANWRAQRGEVDSTSEDGSGSDAESESEEESSSEDEEGKVQKPKGIQGLIECENPNRATAKVTKKVSEIDMSGKTQLTRREKEELAKQRAIAHHQAGKSDQAKADLERLAIVRARRAEAEQKRKDQVKAKEDASAGAGGKDAKKK